MKKELKSLKGSHIPTFSNINFSNEIFSFSNIEDDVMVDRSIASAPKLGPPAPGALSKFQTGWKAEFGIMLGGKNPTDEVPATLLCGQ